MVEGGSCAGTFSGSRSGLGFVVWCCDLDLDLDLAIYGGSLGGYGGSGLDEDAFCAGAGRGIEVESSLSGGCWRCQSRRGGVVWLRQSSVGEVQVTSLAFDGHRVVEPECIDRGFVALPLDRDGLGRELRHGGDVRWRGYGPLAKILLFSR